jgi:hypothetical protein
LRIDQSVSESLNNDIDPDSSSRDHNQVIPRELTVSVSNPNHVVPTFLQPDYAQCSPFEQGPSGEEESQTYQIDPAPEVSSSTARVEKLLPMLNKCPNAPVEDAPETSTISETDPPTEQHEIVTITTSPKILARPVMTVESYGGLNDTRSMTRLANGASESITPGMRRQPPPHHEKVDSETSEMSPQLTIRNLPFPSRSRRNGNVVVTATIQGSEASKGWTRPLFTILMVAFILF